MTHETVHEWGRVAVGDGGFSRAQANSLLAAARAHAIGGAEGTDILCDHHRHLTARQAVGVIAGRGCSLEILPKVDPAGEGEAAGAVRSRLLHMLDVALGLNLSTGEAATMSHRASSLLDLFIALFADRLLSEVRRGLPRRYLGREDDLRTLRGRLDVVRQFTVHAARPDRLACRFDELDADTPLMRIMKACVVLVARHARSFDTQRKLSELRFLLADVKEVAPNELPWKSVRIDRTSLRWQSLLGLVRLLIAGDWQETHAARRQPEGITLLFPMNDLFERYVAIQLRRALANQGFDVVAQGGLEYCLGDWLPGTMCKGSVFRTKPDIIIRRAGRVEAIIDTKWKKLSADPFDRRHGVSPSDVYQLMAYARLYRCERVVLLYPLSHGQVPRGVVRFGISQGPERLEIADIDVSAGGEEVRRRLREMFGADEIIEKA